jgi:hypothetical protein
MARKADRQTLCCSVAEDKKTRRPAQGSGHGAQTGMSVRLARGMSRQGPSTP